MSSALPITRNIIGTGPGAAARPAAAVRSPAPAPRCFAALTKSAWWTQLGEWLRGKGGDETEPEDGGTDTTAWAVIVRRKAALLAIPIGDLGSFGAAIGALGTRFAALGETIPPAGTADATLAVSRKFLACATAVERAAQELGRVTQDVIAAEDRTAPSDPVDDAKRRLAAITALLELLAFANACHRVTPELAVHASCQAWATSVSEAFQAAARVAAAHEDAAGMRAVRTSLEAAATAMRDSLPLVDAHFAREAREALARDDFAREAREALARDDFAREEREALARDEFAREEREALARSDFAAHATTPRARSARRTHATTRRGARFLQPAVSVRT